MVLVAVAIMACTNMAWASKNEKKDASAEKTSTTKMGTASWYGPGFHGKKTSSGDKFDMNGLTCASNHYKLGTWLKVTNMRTGKSVIVRVNDRMHPRMKRIVDLSKGAAREIGMVSKGVSKVKVEDLGRSLPASML
ncbi:MAG TPA: septal ring lytic transglycosylase RlpA family protein [Phnomibacter sp.]|nr:septal ring lytic transglycosylase RlpA family protein [Phnomibacter sp.]